LIQIHTFAGLCLYIAFCSWILSTRGGAIGYRISSPLSSLGHVWAAPNPRGGFDCVLFNLDGGGQSKSKPSNVTLLFSDLGLPSGASVSVRDLWAKEDLPPVTGDRFVAVDVPPHGSMMLTVRASTSTDEL
jgi:hypothetical protein